MILISASNLAAEKVNSAAALAAAEISWSDWPQESLRLIYFNSIKRRNIKNPFILDAGQTPAAGAEASHRRSQQEQAQPQELRPSSEKVEHDRKMFFQAWT